MCPTHLLMLFSPDKSGIDIARATVNLHTEDNQVTVMVNSK